MNISDQRASFKIIILILAMSLLFSLAMFRGLEHHSGYFGNAYQALHPRSFPGDPFMSLTRPTMLSLLYYGLIPLFGEIWLDDRFTFFIFVVIAFFTLIGLDKIAQLLGAVKLSERAAVLSLMLMDHPLLASTHALPIDNFEFNPTTFAAPICLWLLYHALAKSRPITILSFMVLAFLVSVKSAWLPALIALILLCKDQLGRRGKRVALASVFVGGGIALIYYYGVVRPFDGTQPAFFDYVIHYMDNSQANPFADPFWRNFLFGGVCLAGLLLKGLESTVLNRVKWVAATGLVVWLVGGLYLSYAPDIIKIPYLVPFDVTRALIWPQFILYMAIGVFLLKKLRDTRSMLGMCVSWFLLMMLFLNRATIKIELIVVVLLITVVMLLWSLRPKGIPVLWSNRLNSKTRLRIVAAAMCLSTFGQLGYGIFLHRWSALKFLIHYGIMGDNEAAKWAGVNEYICEKVSLSATVLAFSVPNNIGINQLAKKKKVLTFDGSLRIRTGRSMPMAHDAAFYFDYAKLKWAQTQSQKVNLLGQALERQDPSGLSMYLPALGSPDYLVIPTQKSYWLHGVSSFNYSIDGVVGNFTVFRKNASQLVKGDL